MNKIIKGTLRKATANPTAINIKTTNKAKLKNFQLNVSMFTPRFLLTICSISENEEYFKDVKKNLLLLFIYATINKQFLLRNVYKISESQKVLDEETQSCYNLVVE